MFKFIKKLLLGNREEYKELLESCKRSEEWNEFIYLYLNRPGSHTIKQNRTINSKPAVAIKSYKDGVCVQDVIDFCHPHLTEEEFRNQFDSSVVWHEDGTLTFKE